MADIGHKLIKPKVTKALAENFWKGVYYVIKKDDVKWQKLKELKKTKTPKRTEIGYGEN